MKEDNKATARVVRKQLHVYQMVENIRHVRYHQAQASQQAELDSN